MQRRPRNYDFNKKFREYQKKTSLTQEKFANLIGVSTRTIQYWETAGLPSLENLKKSIEIFLRNNAFETKELAILEEKVRELWSKAGFMVSNFDSEWFMKVYNAEVLGIPNNSLPKPEPLTELEPEPAFDITDNPAPTGDIYIEVLPREQSFIGKILGIGRRFYKVLIAGGLVLVSLFILLLLLADDKQLKEWIGLTDHNNAVLGLAFSPDNKHFASSSTDGTVKIREVGSKIESVGKVLKTLANNTTIINNIAFTPDGKYLIGAGKDKHIRVWELGKDGLPVSNLPIKELESTADKIDSLTISPDSKTLAATGSKFNVTLWDIPSGIVSKTLVGHQGQVWEIRFSQDGQKLASTSDDGKVIIWDANSGKLLQELPHHQGPVFSVAFSPDGKFIASADGNGNIILVELANKKEILKFKGHDKTVTSLIFSNDGQTLISGSSDKYIKLWQIPTGKLLKQTPLQETSINILALSIDGKLLASGADTNTITGAKPEIFLRLWRL